MRSPTIDGNPFRKRLRPGETLALLLLFIAASIVVAISAAIIYTLANGSIDFFSSGEASVFEFLTGDKWTPSGKDPQFGVLPLLAGTAMIAGGALLIGAPLGIGAAVYLSEFAGSRTRSILKPVIELLAGIPSIVYGFFALLIISPIFQEHFGASYFNAISAIVVLAIMILPIVVSISDDSMRAVPRELREASYAMGATRWETATRVVIPGASSGIIASLLLGLGRALGETMVVALAAGSIARYHFDPFQGVQTMTAYIAQVATGDIPPGVGVDAAYAVGLLLFIITFIVNMIAASIGKRINTGRSTGKKRRISLEPVTTRIARGVQPIAHRLGETVHKIRTRIRPRKRELTLRRRYIKSRIGMTVTGSSLVVGVIFLAFLMWSVISQGIGGIDGQFLSYFPSRWPDKAGIYPVILGSLYLVALTMIIAVPVGVGAAIYLVEIAPDRLYTRFLRRVIQNLAGVPSIVFGLVGVAIFVRMFDLKLSLLAGSLTLAIMALPIIIVSTEEALKSVPMGFREAARGLGASRWTTVRHHVLPNALPGILTGSILALSRAIGETAPILFIGFTFAKVPPGSVMDPFLALPLTIFYWTRHEKAAFHDLAASTILVLLIILFIMNSIAIIIRHRAQSRRKW